MNNKPATSDISIVLNKINIEELDVKLLESFDQNSSSNGNYNNEEQILIDDNQNRIIYGDISDLELENVNPELQIKPLHWTDEYWHEILMKYKWFMHNNSYIGCKICYNIKVFMGKRSLLGTMKLYLMDLSYEDLEQKLYLHNTSVQHNKSISLYKIQIKDNNIVPLQVAARPHITTVIRTPREIEHNCPMCLKGYKLKKALAKHIYSCNNEKNANNLNIPCKCENSKVFSIIGFDEHNVSFHSNILLLSCKFCSSDFKQATAFFGHLLMFHDFYWNPFEEFPGIIKKSDIIITDLSENNPIKSSTNRPERKKSMASGDDIYIMYGAKDNISFASSKEIHARKINRKRTHSKEKIKKPIASKCQLNQQTAPITDIRIERVKNESNNQEISKLTISQSSIITCEYCGGRYVSMGIFNDHMARYHPHILKKQQEDEEKLIAESKALENKTVSTSALSQINKKVKSTYIRITSHMRKLRVLQMKKKFNMAENAAKKSEDIRRKMKTKDFKSLLAKRNKVSASILTCPICRLLFENLDARLQHVSTNHPELEKFTCKICGLIFTNQMNYRRHLEKSHQNTLPKQIKAEPDKTYSCENCHLVFTNQADLSHHSSLSHPEIQEKIEKSTPNCDLDHIESVKKQPTDELEMLIAADCNESPSQCSNCEIVSNNPFELLVHSYTHAEHTKENQFFQICPNCSRLFFGKHSKIYLKDHYNYEHLKKLIPQCASCKLNFSSSYVLEKHQINNECQSIVINDPYSPLMTTEKLAFSCSQCGLIIAGQNSKNRFDVHMENCSLD